MGQWRIEALWDRPAKLMSQASTHFLLVRVMPHTPSVPPARDENPGIGRQAELAGTTGLPALAVALDCSRSMTENDCFAACADAMALLAREFADQCQLNCSAFSKNIVPLQTSQLAAQLAQLRVRSVSRVDLALGWLLETLAAAGDASRTAVLLSDGAATDAMGHPAAAGALLEQARALHAQGIRLCCAGIGQSDLLETLATAGGGSAMHPSALLETLRRDLQLPGTPGVKPVQPVDSPGLRLHFESRQHGLQLRRVCRLRPGPACLCLTSQLTGWRADAGTLAPWLTLELLVEVALPAAAFGTGEGPDPIIAIAVHDQTGARLCECNAGLDYTHDLRRAQQLDSEVAQVRRSWDMGGLDSWSASEAPLRGRRQTGVLPALPGHVAAPPAGGVP